MANETAVTAWTPAASAVEQRGVFATAERSGRRYETGEALRFCCRMCWLRESPPSTRVLTACDAVGDGGGRRCRRCRRHHRRYVEATVPVVHEAVCVSPKLSARCLRRCLRHCRRHRRRCRRRRHKNRQERASTARGAGGGGGGRRCRRFRHHQGRHVAATALVVPEEDVASPTSGGTWRRRQLPHAWPLLPLLPPPTLAAAKRDCGGDGAGQCGSAVTLHSPFRAAATQAAVIAAFASRNVGRKRKRQSGKRWRQSGKKWPLHQLRVLQHRSMLTWTRVAEKRKGILPAYTCMDCYRQRWHQCLAFPLPPSPGRAAEAGRGACVVRDPRGRREDRRWVTAAARVARIAAAAVANTDDMKRGGRGMLSAN